MSRGRKIKTAFLILSCAAALLLAAWGSQSLEERADRYVAVITKSTESDFFKSVFSGANAAGTEYNLKVSCQGADTEEDFEMQNDLIRRAIEEGAQAIVLSAVDYNGNAAAVEEAAQAGVKVVVIDSDVNSDQVLCRIGTDNYAAGRMAGEAVLAGTKEDLYVGIVNFDKNSANGQQREQGFRERLLEEERVREVTTVNVLSTTEDARAGCVELLKEYPKINVVVTFNEWTSLGVGWAIRDLNAQEEIMVVAFDSNVVSVGMLETGEVDALIVQNPYAMGYLGVETAYDILEKHGVSKTQVDTATTLVTRENMYEPAIQKILFAFD